MRLLSLAALFCHLAIPHPSTAMDWSKEKDLHNLSAQSDDPESSSPFPESTCRDSVRANESCWSDCRRDPAVWLELRRRLDRPEASWYAFEPRVDCAVFDAPRIA